MSKKDRPAPEPYHGKHRAEDRKAQHDPTQSFHVPAPERVARGVGDQQTGGRDD